MKHRSTKACDISPKVRAIVKDRDSPDGYCQCVLCGNNQGIPNAHYIPRDMLGLGIPENIVSLCHSCHTRYDKTSERDELGEQIADYLRQHYKGWDNIQLTYKKGM